jgi:hypothetical protein
MSARVEQEEAWSLILTGFSGDARQLREAARAAFGRSGLSAWQLVGEADRHLPAEIAAGPAHGEARRAARRLANAGSTVTLTPSRGVKGVRHRAGEVWPTRSAGEWHFTEVGELILALPPLAARSAVAEMDSRRPPLAPWQIERFVNHQHVDAPHSCSREGLRQTTRFAARLAAALAEAYPEHHFVVTNWLAEDLVSFYRAVGGAPEEGSTVRGPAPPSSWCDGCGGSQPYALRRSCDAEFPHVEWGDCAACGGEMAIRGPEVLTRVGPGRQA